MKFGLSGITRALTVGAEFSTLQAVNVAVNSMQNVPPIAKFIATASLQFASYEIISKALKSLPPSVKGIASIALKMQVVLAGIQLIPVMMSMIQTQTGSSLIAGTNAIGTNSYAPLALQ